jgi:hypothetical protein
MLGSDDKAAGGHTVHDDQKIRISGMWDSLKRFDSYISTVNFKSGLIASFNTATFAGVILKSDVIIPALSPLKPFLLLSMALVMLASLLSVYWVVKCIWPNLKSSSFGVGGQPSLFFFGSISKNFTPSEYAVKFCGSSVDELERDLSIQVHEVACVSSEKIRLISVATSFTKLNLFALAILSVFFVLEKSGMMLCIA